MTIKRSRCSAVLFFFLATAVLKATTYYVSTSGNDTANGLTLDTAWATIDREQPTRLSAAVAIGATALPVYSTDSLLATGTLKIDSETVAYTNKSATVFYLSSALTAAHVIRSLVYDSTFSGGDGFDGGDLILVNAGVYTQQVDIYKGGVSDVSRLTYKATNGTVVVDGQGARLCGFYLMSVNPAIVGYVTLDGFDITRTTSAGIYFNERFQYQHIIKNCNIYNNYNYGIYSYFNYNANAANAHTILNCNIVGNQGAGIYKYVAAMNIRNCIIVANNLGINDAYAYGGYGLFQLSNNCFYASAVSYNGIAINESAINALVMDTGGKCGGNLVRNPGFVDLAQWKFDRVYAGSPIIGTASDGGNIGSCQNLTVVPVSSANYYVAPPPGGNDGNPGTLASPWATISKGAQVARAGDTVHITNGTYAETVTFTNSGGYTNPVTFLAEGNIQVNAAGLSNGLFFTQVAGVVVGGFKIINATNAGVCLSQSYANTLSNCTITGNLYGVKSMFSAFANSIVGGSILANRSHGVNCEAGQLNMAGTAIGYNAGYGIYLASGYGTMLSNCLVYNNANAGIYQAGIPTSITMLNCQVYSNASYGIYTVGSLTASRCGIFTNRADGIHVYASGGSATLDGCTINNNVGYGAAVEAVSARLIVLNSLVYSNTSHGVAIGLNYNVAASGVQNCTIWSNGGSGVWCGSGMTAGAYQYIINCILANNARYGVEDIAALAYSRFNLFYTNTLANYYYVGTNNNAAAQINALPRSTNNVVADPQLRNPTANDFRPWYNSPCVDAGTTNSALVLTTNWTTDFYGNPRLHGSTIDIGCAEVQSPVGAIFKFH